MVTIYDIAAKTGLSAATVSKVFNNYVGVSSKTREVVLQAAKDMDYMPNTNARALVTKKSWLISLLFSEDIGSGIAHPHFSGILQSAITQVQGHGYDVVFVNKRLGQDDVSYLDHCRYRGVDGVLIAAGSHFTDEIQCVLDSEYTCVSVEEIYPGRHTVISDNFSGTMQALEYLYFLGHRKIAHIAGPKKRLAGRERYEAYVSFLSQKGIPYNPKYVVEAEYFRKDEGFKATTELLQQCWDDMPTAIFAAYDELACAAKTVLLSRGFRVPKDMSIIGFDDLPIAETPGITTIRQDRRLIGQMAGDMLVKLIEGGDVGEPMVHLLPTKLITRESCARIAEE